MRPSLRIALAAGILAAAQAASSMETASACASEQGARGIAQRLDNLRGQMRRIEEAEGEQQQRLMDLHLKSMQEGMRELRNRGASEACRLEVMEAMMEQLLHHQLAAQETPRR